MAVFFAGGSAGYILLFARHLPASPVRALRENLILRGEGGWFDRYSFWLGCGGGIFYFLYLTAERLAGPGAALLGAALCAVPFCVLRSVAGGGRLTLLGAATLGAGTVGVFCAVRAGNEVWIPGAMASVILLSSLGGATCERGLFWASKVPSLARGGKREAAGSSFPLFVSDTATLPLWTGLALVGGWDLPMGGFPLLFCGGAAAAAGSYLLRGGNIRIEGLAKNAVSFLPYGGSVALLWALGASGVGDPLLFATGMVVTLATALAGGAIGGDGEGKRVAPGSRAPPRGRRGRSEPPSGAPRSVPEEGGKGGSLGPPPRPRSY